MKKIFVFAVAALLLGSCASKKELEAAQEENRKKEELLNTATTKLNDCITREKLAQQRIETMDERMEELKNTNQALLNNVGDLATLSKKEAENLEKSLESIREKDLQIRSLNEAMNKKDSVTLALVTSLKSSLGNMNDEDISVNVEKGVVYISISDKLLFSSGSYRVTEEAKRVLGKVAKVVNDKPEIDIMVEGHTDDKSINQGQITDNWDLSVKRATSVVRVLQNDFEVAPERMTAAGRSFYIPVASNETAAGRAKNRRTRIIVLPKLDQFFQMIEDGMEEAKRKAHSGE